MRLAGGNSATVTEQASNGTRVKSAVTRLPGLDGVRVLAVIAVIAFHEQSSVLPGGFLGVDVFFVLSGYLITDLLVAQLHRHGRLRLGNFWARRARRLRAALLAAVTYSSNWWQALHHQSYFTRFGPPPPLQHLWSLAIAVLDLARQVVQRRLGRTGTGSPVALS